jgi:hypothetical protein
MFVYRVIIGIALALMLLGAAIIAAAVYIAIQPVPATCQSNGTGCGAPPLASAH